MDKLKPCPFCGKNGKIVKDDTLAEFNTVGCTDCGVYVYRKTVKECVKNWNTRAKGIDNLSASEALYGFCGWITTRKGFMCAGSELDCSPWAEAINAFCETNNLEDPRDNWTDNLTYPEETT